MASQSVEADRGPGWQRSCGRFDKAARAVGGLCCPELPGPAYMSPFLERAFAQQMRSTALQPLQWGLGLLLAATVGVLKAGAPPWLVVLFGSLSGLCALLYGASYIYFLRKNPDALRSERYTLQKMAIERGIVGDSQSGLVKEDELARQRVLPIEAAARLESGK